jgi:hypothetical protein
MKIFRRKQSRNESTPEEPITPELRDTFNTRLVEIDQELLIIKQSQHDLFAAKTAGNLHDAQYNQMSDGNALRIQMLESERAYIIDKIGSIQAGLASIALRNPAGK